MSRTSQQLVVGDEGRYQPIALHLKGSFAAGYRARLPAVAAAARDQGHSWNDIAAQLGVTPAAARRHYDHHHNTTDNTR